MKERKFKLFLGKLPNSISPQEAKAEFYNLDSLKKQHLTHLSDEQIETFLFSKVDQTKGNVSIIILFIVLG